jgi:hypothetical protein
MANFSNRWSELLWIICRMRALKDIGVSFCRSENAGSRLQTYDTAGHFHNAWKESSLCSRQVSQKGLGVTCLLKRPDLVGRESWHALHRKVLILAGTRARHILFHSGSGSHCLELSGMFARASLHNNLYPLLTEYFPFCVSNQ